NLGNYLSVARFVIFQPFLVCWKHFFLDPWARLEKTHSNIAKTKWFSHKNLIWIGYPSGVF
ncbi:MAG: hypothetical protein Q4E67_03870, partial [Planctomycetia bacterium]|nr:hypothetical protein [Planctomycetia bacterium]